MNRTCSEITCAPAASSSPRNRSASPFWGYGACRACAGRRSRCWPASAPTTTCAGAPMRLDHPQVGELRLNREKLVIGGTAGPMLVIYHPDPGTDNADKLSLLASAMQTPAAPQGTTASEPARADYHEPKPSAIRPPA